MHERQQADTTRVLLLLLLLLLLLRTSKKSHIILQQQRQQAPEQSSTKHPLLYTAAPYAHMRRNYQLMHKRHVCHSSSVTRSTVGAGCCCCCRCRCHQPCCSTPKGASQADGVQSLLPLLPPLQPPLQQSCHLYCASSTAPEAAIRAYHVPWGPRQALQQDAVQFLQAGMGVITLNNDTIKFYFVEKYMLMLGLGFRFCTVPASRNRCAYDTNKNSQASPSAVKAHIAPAVLHHSHHELVLLHEWRTPQNIPDHQKTPRLLLWL
jgi:hypothetical protein